MSAVREPSVSVVVAAHGTGAPLAACVAAHEREVEAGDEVVVVVAAPDAEARAFATGHPRVRVLREEPAVLTPHLWRRGIEESAGDFVRTTIAECVPQPGWRKALREAHARDAVAVGGAIEPGADLRLRDWAVLFLRYRAYLLPFARRAVTDVPGDHASYARAALDETAPLWAGSGFWEREVNLSLARAGRRLELDPAFVVRYEGGEEARAFLRQRFLHGIEFGRARLAGSGPARRLVHVAAFLLPGVVFAAKIAAATVRKRRALGHFALALPWIALFLLAWSAGEWVGAVRGAPRPA